MMESSVKMGPQPCRDIRNWCHTAIGSGSTITDARILNVNGITTIDGASTLSGTVAIGGGYTKEVCTPLHCAITEDQAVTCRMLLDHRSDVCKPSKEGFTPLYCANQKGQQMFTGSY